MLPKSATADAARLIATRGARGFADGIASVLLASYLTRLGFTPLQIGAIVTATLLGSAALMLAVGLAGHRWRRRAVLLAASALMFATGLGFYASTRFWPLLLVAFGGTR
jgi:MFS family permease